MMTTERLLAELQQTRPFHSLAQAAAIALLRTADVVRRRVSAELEAHRLTMQQYNVLRILRGAGEPLPVLTIADRLIERAPGITRLIDRLEEKGFLERRGCPEDRRRTLVALTDAGRELLTTLDPVVNAADANAIGALAPEQLPVLLDLLDAIRRDVSDAERTST
jgi:DNA-binding MarR family transcriptional regulator